MSEVPGGSFRPVKSTLRTLEVLEHLAGASERVSLGELTRALGIPKSSLHGILRTMQQRGWVDVDEGGQRYGLGVRALRVGTAYVDADDVVSLTSVALDWLVETLDETVHLGRLDGTDIIYLAKRESSHALRMFSAVGRRLPSYATALGKSVLAGLPEEQLAEHLPATLAPLTRRTITDHDRLRAELETVRERGYAIDNEENSEGICCVAVTLPTSDPPIEAISCSVPVVRFGAERMEKIIECLQEGRRRVAGTLPRKTI